MPLSSLVHSPPPLSEAQTAKWPSGGIREKSPSKGATYTRLGSLASTATGNPKREGRFPLMSFQSSPASSLLKTPLWFCWNITSGADEFSASLCTHVPYSGYLLGRKSASTCLFLNFQVSPESSVRIVPTADIAMCILF